MGSVLCSSSPSRPGRLRKGAAKDREPRRGNEGVVVVGRLFTSLQFKTVCHMRSGRPICAPPRLSEVFPPALPLKLCLIDGGPLSSFQERLLRASSFSPPPGDLWCDVLGFV